MRKLAVLLLALPVFAQQADDAILRAMRDEQARIKMLGLANVDAPYYAEYSLDDAEIFHASASLGGLLDSGRNRLRVPRVQVRVGSPEFDNTNFFARGSFGGYDLSEWPVDDNYAVLRQQLWLASDRSFKSAAEAISRKRAALGNMNQAERLNDYGPAEALLLIQPVKRASMNEAPWTALVRKLSAVFSNFPAVTGSTVEFEDIQTVSYYVNTGGTAARTQDRVSYVRIRASGLAPDGSRVRDGATIERLQIERLPGEDELRAAVERVGANVTALARAPLGETYSGPVLFEEQAAAQLFAQLLGNNLALTRRPVSEPSRPVSAVANEFEGRIGSRVLPEWMDVVDDATQREWQGQPLFGFYPIDMEGVAPKPVSVIEKGVLKAYLTTRQPVPGSEGTNGHARLPGSLGNRAARISNLFVRASQPSPREDLKKKLIELAKQRGKPYGLLIRKLDFPAAPSRDEIRGIAAAMQAAGSGRPVSPPLLAYRVYPDGREELVRGMRFRGLSARSLKDIVAASDRAEVFDFLDNGAVFAIIGMGGYVANCSVISPGVLMDDVELERPQADTPAPPLVPPPPVAALR